MPSLPQINFKLPLNMGDLGPFDMNTNTKDAVRENLKLTILTTKGERVINEVGSKYQFDVFTQTKDEVKAAITDHTNEIFNIYFPFLNIESLEIFTQDENNAIEDNQVYVKLIYSFKGVEGFTDQINFAI